MRVALGLKARIGRAIVVAVGHDGAEIKLIERDEVKLLPEGAFAPYHAAEGLAPEQARKSVNRSIAAAHRLAQQAVHDAIGRITNAGHQIDTCGVLVGTGMPNWTTDEILSAHVRMHQAEGELFRNVLIEGAKALKLKVATLPHQSPFDAAVETLGLTRDRLEEWITSLGKQGGPPWGQHQKEAAVAAIVALWPAIRKSK